MAPEPSVHSLALVCRTVGNTHLRQPLFGGDNTMFLSYSSHERSFMKKRFTKAFVRVWKVLEICYQLLEHRKKATQREIFYRMLSDAPELFNCQRQVNEAIQDVVALLRCSRHSLGILASSRGALVGHLIIQEPSGDLIDCTTLGTTGQVISGDLKQLQSWKFFSDARYILLVEKDAIFQRLAEDRFFQSIPCIMITAKGYPDLASRVFLHQLRCAYPSLPILALVDWNPAGLAIICTLKFGSIRMGLEAPSYVCDVKWLGLRGDDLQYVPRESLLPLTIKDNKLAKSLLGSKMLQNNDRYRKELIHMLQTGERAEIEALYAHGYNFLSKLMAQKIVQRDYI